MTEKEIVRELVLSRKVSARIALRDFLSGSVVTPLPDDSLVLRAVPHFLLVALLRDLDRHSARNAN